MLKNRFHLAIVATVLALNVVPAGLAKQAFVDSPLDEQTQKELSKAAGYLKSKNAHRATPIILNALQAANDIPKCLAICAYTEARGFPLLEARRECLAKALSLCQTPSDYMQVALKSRQYQCYEVTREAINSLIGTATSPEELYDLAKKSQEVALNDVAHLAMEKAYTQVKTVPQALDFSRQAKLLSMDDLTRKTVKDLIDDEGNAHELIVLLKNIEPLKLKDLDRYCMKKALDHAAGEEDFLDIYNAAQRHGETDLFNIALYRGKKSRLMKQIKEEREAARQTMEEQAAKAQQDLSNKVTSPTQQQNTAGF